MIYKVTVGDKWSCKDKGRAHNITSGRVYTIISSEWHGGYCFVDDVGIKRVDPANSVWNDLKVKWVNLSFKQYVNKVL